MKKRIIAIVLCVIMLSINVFATSPRIYGKNYGEYAVEKLEKFDIVRKPFEKYDENSTITRSDMMKMIYIAVNANFDARYYGNARQYIYHTDEKKGMHCGGTEEVIENFNYLIENSEEQGWCYYEFEDIEFGSEEHCFVSSLMYYGLFHGVERDGKMYAELEREATYREAIIALCNMFGWQLSDFRGISDYRGTDFDLEYTKKLGIIEDENPRAERMEIDLTELEKPVRAYEFMNLLYNALHIPFDRLMSDWSGERAYEYRYYEGFVDIKNGETDTAYEAITD